MVMEQILNVSKIEQGRRPKEIRKQGLVPAVCYGKSMESTQVAIPQSMMKKTLKSGHNSFYLKLEGKKYHASIKEVQWNMQKTEVEHVSFHCFSDDETVTYEVPVHFHTTLKKIEGVIKTHQEKIKVTSKASDMIDEIDVNLDHLELGSYFRVEDLMTKYDVTFHSDPMHVLFSYQVQKVQEEEPVQAVTNLTQLETPEKPVQTEETLSQEKKAS